MENLNGPFLFESMYAEDVEGSKLACLPGVGELLETYRDKFVIICLNLFECGLKQQEKRKAELDTFSQCVQEAIQENQEQGRQRITKFEETHLLSLSAIRDASELTTLETRLVACRERVAELFNSLMMLEMQLAEQLEETISLFERNIADLVGLFVENVQSLMAQCRDLENHHHEKLLEAAINTLEKTVKGELDEDLPDDVRAVSAGASGGRRHSAVRSTAGVSGPAPQGGALRPRVSCAEVQQQVCHALGRAPLSFLRH